MEALISAVIALLDYAVPKIQEGIEKKQISPEKQAALKERINALRLATAFEGEEWNPSTPKTPPPAA